LLYATPKGSLRRIKPQAKALVVCSPFSFRQCRRFHPEPGPGRPLRNPRRDRNTIVFLASDESSFAVGSELVIDGGLINL
jgi:NAD(P)-dependent dehydrogenase (short-subunit alcohol dehydrogenase family)